MDRPSRHTTSENRVGAATTATKQPAYPYHVHIHDTNAHDHDHVHVHDHDAYGHDANIHKLSNDHFNDHGYNDHDVHDNNHHNNYNDHDDHDNDHYNNVNDHDQDDHVYGDPAYDYATSISNASFLLHATTNTSTNNPNDVNGYHNYNGRQLPCGHINDDVHGSHYVAWDDTPPDSNDSPLPTTTTTWAKMAWAKMAVNNRCNNRAKNDFHNCDYYEGRNLCNVSVEQLFH